MDAQECLEDAACKLNCDDQEFRPGPAFLLTVQGLDPASYFARQHRDFRENVFGQCSYTRIAWNRHAVVLEFGKVTAVTVVP